MKRLLLSGGVGLLLMAAVAGLYAGYDGASAAPSRDAETAEVKRRTVTRTSTFQGSVEFGAQIEITAPRDGLLAELPVRIGQSVAAGQLLARFQGELDADDREFEREADRHDHWLTQTYPAQQRSLHSAARALELKHSRELGAVAAKLRATRQAREEGIATQAEYEAARRELQDATAQADGERLAQTAQLSALDQQRVETELGRSSARAKQLALRRGDAAMSLRAPIAAAVAAVSVETHGPTRVAAGAHLLTLVDTSSFTLAVPVPPAEIARLSRSAPQSCYLPRRGRAAPCRLRGIVKADQGYVARFALSQVGDLERGEPGDVRLHESGPKTGLAVPQNALARRGDDVGVRVLRAGQPIFVPVRVHFFGDSEVAISGRLQPGERLLLD